MVKKTISRYCPFKSPEGRNMMIHTCLFANLILSHFLKKGLFDKPFLCAVVSKGCNFSRQKSVKSFTATKIEYDDVMLISKFLNF
jgi:hypothetical protein